MRSSLWVTKHRINTAVQRPAAAASSIVTVQLVWTKTGARLEASSPHHGAPAGNGLVQREELIAGLYDSEAEEEDGATTGHRGATLSPGMPSASPLSASRSPAYMQKYLKQQAESASFPLIHCSVDVHVCERAACLPSCAAIRLSSRLWDRLSLTAHVRDRSQNCAEGSNECAWNGGDKRRTLLKR